MYLFIVNPVSGKGRTQKVWTMIQQELKQRQLAYQVEFTESPKHATQIAATAAQNPDIHAVIAVGGDGTLHEVANGLVNTRKSLGFIPLGTGNDFSISSNISRDPMLALERILRNNPQPIDTAFFQDKVAICNMGIGFDGKVAEMVSKSSWKRYFGKLAYPFKMFQALGTYRPIPVKLTVDGQVYEMDRTWLVAICNIATYGGGMRICPAAKENDGFLDVCCVRDVSRTEFLRVFPAVYKGTHIHHPSVKILRGREIQIESGEKLIVHADGEIVGETPISIKVLANSLWVL